VDDLVAHIDGGAEFLQRPVDDLDRPHYTGAKPAGLSQDHFDHAQFSLNVLLSTLSGRFIRRPHLAIPASIRQSTVAALQNYNLICGGIASWASGVIFGPPPIETAAACER
jgi:hypothetical protein